MPNHVTNVLRAEPKVFSKLIRGYTDFELEEARKVYEQRLANYREQHPEEADNPLPSWFWDEPTPEFRFVDFDLVVPSPPNKEQDSCSMKHEPGVICWHTWNTQNWGTKWNGYDLEGGIVLPDGRMEYRFDTAWSHPFPVIEALSKAFPQSEIEVLWADEDFGYNVGSYKIIEGMIIGEIADLDGTDAGKELAAQVKYGLPYAEVKAEWDEEERLWEEQSEAAKRPGPHGPSDSVGTCTCGYEAGADLERHLSMVEYHARQQEKEAAK